MSDKLESGHTENTESIVVQTAGGSGHEATLSRAYFQAVFALLDTRAFGIAAGLLCAGVLSLATIVVFLQEPEPGMPVGAHLILLANYFPGYTVSWAGAAIGALYGFLVGFLIGSLIATLWNLSRQIYVALARSKRLIVGVFEGE